MKKFLSLVLALVMTMSLVTVSAGAKDFKDDGKITYAEAVAVMSEVKVLDGYADGSFKPQGELTRGAAAKIICNLILGPTTAAELHADTAPFKDVPIDHTFAGYIAYCAKEGIISGYADGAFRPAAPLTGYAFMKMLLGALGYDQEIEQFVGANWSINVAKRALGIGLNKGLKTEFNGIKSVTREEAALYAFNTLKATMVDYDSRTTVTVGGADVIIAGSTAKEVEWAGHNNADGNIKNDNLVQFAEKYFSKLKSEADSDDFGRPTTKWVNNKKDIGSYVNYGLLAASYTDKVEGGEVYSDIGSTPCKFDLTYWVDGKQLDKDDTKIEAEKLVKKNDDKMNASGKGVLTEVYTDLDTEETTIVVINTWLGEVEADYNEKTESVRISVYDDYIEASGDEKPYAGVSSYTVKSEDVAGLEDLKEEDMVLVNIADDEIMIVSDVEQVSDVSITSYSVDYQDADKKNGKMVNKLTANGEKYEVAAKAFEDAAFMFDYDVEDLEDTTYNLYLDPYGYVIGVRKVTADDKYVFVVGYDVNAKHSAKAIDEALVIFTDGTMESIKVRDNDLDLPAAYEKILTGAAGDGNSNVNRWFTYTEKNGVYNLEKLVKNQIVDTTTTELNRDNVSVVDKDNAKQVAHGNNKSVFITVDVGDDINDDGSIVDVNSVSNGIKGTSIEVEGDEDLDNFDGKDSDEMIFAIYSGHYITYAVVVGDDAGNNDDMLYLTSFIKSKELSNGDYIWTYEGLNKDGETVLKSFVAKDINKDNLADDTMYTVTYDKDGTATKLEKAKEQKLEELNTKQYREDGYVYKNFNQLRKLVAEDDTFYFDANDNERYILMEEGCNFWVYASDDDEYVEYKNAKSALSALGKNSNFTGTIAAFVNELGYATTIILKDTYKENDEVDNNDKTDGKMSDAIIEKKGDKLVAKWTDDGSYNGKEVVVKFYLKENNKSYLKDTATGTCSSAADHSQSSSSTINQNGDYYAVITVLDADGKVIDKATTNTDSFAF